MAFEPSLEFVDRGDTVVLSDTAALDQGISIAFTTREGGASAGPFSSLNLSERVGDDAAAVESNRAKIAAAVEAPRDGLRFARQVHGNGVAECDPAIADVGDADALVARDRGLVAGVLTADCVPVLLWGPEGVAAVHAGWRGVVAGAVDAAMGRLGAVHAAWVGPSIHACCYEVGPEVTSAFESQGLPITDPWHVDPARAVIAQLRRAGVERVAASGLCTSCDPRFFSHRRDKVTGRQGGFIALL